jgi:hypothetical protein
MRQPPIVQRWKSILTLIVAAYSSSSSRHSCRAWMCPVVLQRLQHHQRRPCGGHGTAHQVTPTPQQQRRATTTTGTHLPGTVGRIPTGTTPTPTTTTTTTTTLTHHPPPLSEAHAAAAAAATTEKRTNVRSKLWRRVLGRLDTIAAAGYTANGEVVLAAGLFGKVKQLHNPIVYFVLGILAGFRWDWCFKSPIYWFAIGFTIKWYRARYVLKIPVWDRQPNWNNIITSKEQEKGLKAFTCKKCGSTIFIAKTREFFFEGNTGIGGLGCFSCGAKGKENFMMDRDRILEDVGDMDDYFEYERPLDFVSRAERRRLLKEAQGDEERANQILLERAGDTATATDGKEEPAAVEEEDSIDFVDAVIETESPATWLENEETVSKPDVESVDDVEALETKPAAELETEPIAEQVNAAVEDSAPEAKRAAEFTTTEANEKVDVEPVKKKKAKAPKTPKASSSTTSKKRGDLDLDGLDELDMDAW